MATNLLWFVMAGFLLGFATSTLWEWFYFRKERLKLTDRRIRELEAKLRENEGEAGRAPADLPAGPPLPTVNTVAGHAPRTSAWGDTPYRSPGVFLESEEMAGESEAMPTPAPRPRSGQPGGPSVPSPLAPTATVPPVLPTVNSIAAQVPPAASSSFVPNNLSDADFTTRADGARQEAARQDAPSPADALRAKRNPSPRSRQELLAELRRNSEAMQRGQFPLAADDVNTSATDENVEEELSPFAPRTTLVTSTPAPSSPPSAPPNFPVEPPPPALPPARLRWINDAKLTARSKEYPDDLSKIKGIGDVYKQRLYRAGFHTWKQIAEADTETLRRATSAYPSSNVEEWLVQAERLMEKHGRKNALYSGPLPDDMTKILGIGPVGAAVLYRAGICTYEQLATTPIAELEALFPIAVAGDQPDFAQWVARATTLADEKHGDKK